MNSLRKNPEEKIKIKKENPLQLAIDELNELSTSKDMKEFDLKSLHQCLFYFYETYIMLMPISLIGTPDFRLKNFKCILYSELCNKDAFSLFSVTTE